MKRRLIGLLSLAPASALIALGLGAHPAVADNEPGSGFQALALRAVSSGQQFSGDTLAGTAPGSAAGGVPYTEADMGLSGAHALASVAWPGALPGNAGSLLLLLGPSPCVPGDDPVTHQPIPVVGGLCDTAAPVPQPVMDQYHYLNSPVRAEAQYPSQPQASQDAPGAGMEAATSASTAAASAVVGGGYTSDGLRFGTSTSTTALRVTGPRSAESSGSSLLKDLSVAGGVVTADSVASHAQASTAGSTSGASGDTTIDGLKVGGIPVTVDGSGIHAAGTGAPAGPATDAVAGLLKNAGIQMYATQPSKQVDRGAASYRAGSLVIVWDVDQAGPKDDIVIVLGGAEASAIATLPYAAGFAVPPLPPVGAPSAPVGTTGSATSPSLPSSGGQLAGAPGNVPPPVTTTQGQVSLVGLNLPAGWSGATIVGLGLLFGLAGLLLAGVPARVTGATGQRRCDWEDR